MNCNMMVIIAGVANMRIRDYGPHVRILTTATEQTHISPVQIVVDI